MTDTTLSDMVPASTAVGALAPGAARRLPVVPASVPGGPHALASLAVVDASGTEAVAFLQGQLSNDLAGAGASRACLAGYCNPKGRLLALPLVLTLPDGGLRLIVPRELVAGFLQRLGMFVMRADVAFTERTDLRCLGLTVPESAAGAPLEHGVAALPTTPPAEPLDVLGGESGAGGAQICRWHDAHAPERARRYLLIVDGANSPEGASGEADGDDGAASVGDAAWRLGDISAGLPRVGLATREAFVPQMVNLQLVDGLSFRKGCYPGQEIVARMQYLGKLKRHMRRFVAATGPGAGASKTGDEAEDSGTSEDVAALLPGATLVAGGDADAGRVVDAVRTAEGVELLAVVKIGTDAATLRAGGTSLEARPLPYALSDEPPGGPGGGKAKAESGA